MLCCPRGRPGDGDQGDTLSPICGPVPTSKVRRFSPSTCNWRFFDIRPPAFSFRYFEHGGLRESSCSTSEILRRTQRDQCLPPCPQTRTLPHELGPSHFVPLAEVRLRPQATM